MQYSDCLEHVALQEQVHHLSAQSADLALRIEDVALAISEVHLHLDPGGEQRVVHRGRLAVGDGRVLR